MDYLKIDGGFVRDINTDPVDLAMVRAIHEVGQILGLTTIAEHVEDDAIRARLVEVGITSSMGRGSAWIVRNRWSQQNGSARRIDLCTPGK